ncbi:DNA-binding CsgD family transcriptional regulator (plasmid) [Ensifer sp. WSM1721]|uniref:helix-turn-helix transcriptional regulator n=1 Tax=Ensifer sp. WSM1721 TaxID=1041159 RepID=UPI00047C5CB3|nr:helix-turn-helix transcriptional regulator [Ensifer sp. WSM1721]
MTETEYSRIGQLIRSCGDAGFCPSLQDWLRAHAAFDLFSIVIYRGSEAPIHLFDNFPDAGARDGMMTFLTQTYVLNAFFQQHQKGLPTGVYRLRDLAPDANPEDEQQQGLEVIFSDKEEAGYITSGWPQELEEVDIAVDLGEKLTVEIGLYRKRSTARFEEDNIRALEMMLPVITAGLSKHWQLVGKQLAFSKTRQATDATSDFEGFGENVLSAREREVTAMILRGHSSESIASHLDISITTVKTHRKRAYQKLSISTQAELLSLFLKHVQMAPSGP